MNTTRQLLRPVSLVMAAMLILVSGPVQTAGAAMIGTHQAVEATTIANTREQLNRLLERQKVQDELIRQGIQPGEARQRIASLTDAELLAVGRELDRLPAGAGFLEVVGFVVVAGFLVLLITDMLGFTDVFPFINAADKRAVPSLAGGAHERDS